MSRELMSLVVALATLGFWSGACLAQVDRAGLNGTVRDVTGRRISAASVEVTATETDLRREATASASGAYDIVELPIGLYRVRVTAPGFEETIYPSARVC